MSGPISGAGTSESVWSAWIDHMQFPDLPLDELAEPLVVVAPHPDDEVLGVGGLLALLARRGLAATVVAVTEGEAFAGPPDPATALGRAQLRARERRRAFSQLGARPRQLVRLGLADGRVWEVVERLEGALEELASPGSTLLAPMRLDGHPDHEASAAAALAVARRQGARLLQYPVWLWHWALPADPLVSWPRARVAHLPDWARDAKQRAIGEFASQLEGGAEGAVLPPQVVDHFLRPHELLFV
ncbi:MAG: PIG-L deacetylase family protein [Candidatus Dormibacteria bacterium]